MKKDLQNKHRPKSFKDVLGQPQAVKELTAMIENDAIPQCLMFTGPSGTGKTTLARIVAHKVKCFKGDLHELNCADFRGIEVVRDIRSRVGLSPMHGESCVWIIDEAQQLSKDAQSAMLKLMEDGAPDHVYFFVCTTDPHKILRTLKGRCTPINLSAIRSNTIEKLVSNICEKEKVKLSDDLIAKIAEVADGSAREALVMLNKVKHIEDEEQQLEAVCNSDVKRQAIEIASALLNPGTKWGTMARILQEVLEKETDYEGIRYLILGYMTSVMIGKDRQPPGKMVSRAAVVSQHFLDNFYDSKKAGLVNACYQALHTF